MVATTVSEPTRTIIREYGNDAERDGDIARHAAHGWQVQSVTHERGQYRARRGFALAVVATPAAALLAGHTPGRWIVVYTAPPGTAEPPPLPPRFLPPPRAVPIADQRAALRWGALLFLVPVVLAALVVAVLILLPH